MIQGTWEDAARSVPLWATQGRRHRWQSAIWEEAQTEDGVIRMTEAHARRFLEEEAMSIRDRYQPRTAAAPLADDDLISQRFRMFRRMDQSAAALGEEQERELSPEVERERQTGAEGASGETRPALLAPRYHRFRCHRTQR